MRAAKTFTRKRPRFLIMTYCTTIETDARLSFREKRREEKKRIAGNKMRESDIRIDDHDADVKKAVRLENSLIMVLAVCQVRVYRVFDETWITRIDTNLSSVDSNEGYFE